MAAQPATLQLRYLQTLTEISSERNSTVIFPIPIDLINIFLGRGAAAPAAGAPGPATRRPIEEEKPAGS
jgi:hypothetical protein